MITVFDIRCYVALINMKTYNGYNKKETEICWLIWGCVPIDYDWAKNTNIFKDALGNAI